MTLIQQLKRTIEAVDANEELDELGRDPLDDVDDDD